MNLLLRSATFAADFSPVLLDAALKSAALLALAMLVVLGMRRCSAAARHLALFAVVGSLLVLPLFTWALPRLNLLPSWLSRSSTLPQSPEITRAVAAAAPVPAANVAGNRAAPPATHSVSGAEDLASVSSVRRTSETDTITGRWWRWLPALWGVGFLGALAPTGLGLISLRRVRREARVETSSRLWMVLMACAAELRLRHPLRLLTSDRRQMPMAWGFLQPCILLPDEARAWPEERLRLVLLHELAHIGRGDFLTTLSTRIACAFYWFNPLVWLAARQLRLDQEQACDDIVLGSGILPATYAEEVLRVAAGQNAENLDACGVLAMARPSALEGRLLAILDSQRNRASLTRVTAIGVALVTLLAVVPLSMLQAQQPAATVSASSPKDGLISWWRADGDGKDSVGNHDGEFPFGIRFRTGFKGQAFDFRRSFVIEQILQRVSIQDSPDFQLSETFTLEARIHPLRPSGIVLLRGDERPGFDTWQLDLLTPGKISFNFDDAENKSAELLAPIAFGKWQHVVATFERGAMKIYIDGELVASAQTQLRPNAVLDTRHRPALGIGDSGGTRYSIPFDGLIDEVRIYNRALSAAEIVKRLKD